MVVDSFVGLRGLTGSADHLLEILDGVAGVAGAWPKSLEWFGIQVLTFHELALVRS